MDVRITVASKASGDQALDLGRQKIMLFREGDEHRSRRLGIAISTDESGEADVQRKIVGMLIPVFASPSGSDRRALSRRGMVGEIKRPPGGGLK